MGTIPASAIVSVTPNVISAGGSSLDVIGLILTSSTRAPIGSVPAFATAADVGDYFGGSSAEKAAATTYFNGFENSNRKPGSVLFAQYPEAAVAAYLRGGNVSSLTLAQLQALTGSLTVAIDGFSFAVGSINLSPAASFSAAAGIIQTALQAAVPPSASVTGSIGGVVTASSGATFTGSGSGTNLTITGIAGVLHVGALISGTGVPAGTTIVSQTSGTAGSNGVYVTSGATTSSGASLVAESNVLDVTAVASGSLQPTDEISGTGVDADVTVIAQLSGTAGGVGLYTLSERQQFASASVTSLSTVLKVTAVGSGSLGVGSMIAGTNIVSGTTIAALGTGTGGVGTYVVSAATTTISETITVSVANPTVAYDSTSGAFVVTSGSTGANSSIGFATGTLAAAIKLTSATGAVTSQGAAAAVPGTFMDALVEITQNWVTFMTLFDPDDSGHDNKLAFAEWTSDQNDRYAYVCWDTDASPTVSNPATGSLGYAIQQASLGGTTLWYDPLGPTLPQFILGIGASINFEQLNGRVNFAFRRQDGIAATCTDQTAMNNLIANGYSFYGAFATANDEFVWTYDASISGDFLWLDSYVNQVWMNNGFQLALMSLLQDVYAIPYNSAGRALIAAGLADPINAAVNFGAIREGVVLSSSQAAQVNSAAGVRISDILQQRGWYLQVLDASPIIRAARGSPPCTFWYMDGQSVQKINLTSVQLQ